MKNDIIALIGNWTEKEVDDACYKYDTVYLISPFDYITYNLFVMENLKKLNNLVIYKDFPQIIETIDEWEPDLKFDNIFVKTPDDFSTASGWILEHSDSIILNENENENEN